MAGEKRKRDGENLEPIHGDHVLFSKKLQEIQGELEKIHTEASVEKLKLFDKHGGIRKRLHCGFRKLMHELKKINKRARVDKLKIHDKYYGVRLRGGVDEIMNELIKIIDKACDADLEIVQERKRLLGELVEIMNELKKINQEATDKRLEIVQKYYEMCRPVYDKRNEIIQSIPNFWLTAFLRHPTLGELLTAEDQEKFKYISSLEVDDSKDAKLEITFNFRPNPFFEDSKLAKTYSFLDEGTKITATSIKWKEGMEFPNGVACEKKGNNRPLSDESFFHWFSDAEINNKITEAIATELWENPTHFDNMQMMMMKRRKMMALRDDGNGSDEQEDSSDEEEERTELLAWQDDGDGSDEEEDSSDEEEEKRTELLARQLKSRLVLIH